MKNRLLVIPLRKFSLFDMKRMLVFMLAFVVLLSCSISSQAVIIADSLNLKIHFRVNSSQIDMTYLNNRKLLSEFISEMKKVMSDPSCHINNVVIHSRASLEGGNENNQELSLKRGVNLMLYLQSALSLPAKTFVLDAVGEDWAEFRNIVEKNNIPDRADILDVLDRYQKYLDGEQTFVYGDPKKDLMDLNGGRTWKWLMEYVFPELRSTGNNTVCRFTRDVKPIGYAAERVCDTVVVIHKYVIEVDSTKISKNTPLKVEIVIPGEVDTSNSNQIKVGNTIIDTSSFGPNVEVRSPNEKNVDVTVDNKVVLPRKRE